MSEDREPGASAPASSEPEAQRPDDHQTLAEFLAMYDNGSNQFIITRHEPKTAFVNGQWKKASGHCETLHHYPTPEYIRENWGGGVYEIRVMGPEKGKGMRFKASRRLEVVGDPKLKADAVQATPSQNEQAMMSRVLEQQFEEKRRMEDRLERERQQKLVERPTSQDPNLVQTTLGAIQQSAKQQAEMLREQLTRRDQELSEMRQAMEALRRERSSLENPEVLKVLFGRNDDGGRQLELLRHELLAERERAARDLQLDRERSARELQAERERASRELGAERERAGRELETERERASRDLEAERREHEKAVERAARDLEAERREHEKAVTLLDRLHHSDVENLRAAHAQLIATKDAHIDRVEKELAAVRSQERPHDTLSDLERMGKVVTAMRTFIPGVGAEPAEQAPLAERLIEYGVEKFVDVAAKAQQAVAAQVAVPTVAVPPSWVPPMATPLLPRPIAPPVSMRRPAVVPAAPPQPAPPAATVAPRKPVLTPQLLQGLSFVETALHNNHAPADVARTALSLFPRGDLEALCAAGPEKLIAEVEASNADSILASPAGRRFVRELIDALGGILTS